MAASQHIQSLQEEATCSVCLGYYSDPVIAKCGHHFCRPCITLCAQGSQGADPLCPECRLPCPLAELRPNRQLQSIVGIARGLEGSLAQTLHSQQEEGGLCGLHQERLKLFCEQDETLICVICREAEEHELHKVRPLQEAAVKYKGKLQDWLPPLRKEAERIMKSKVAEEDAAKDMTKKLEAERLKTVAEFRRLHALLEDQEQKILTRLDEMNRKISLTEKANVEKLSTQISLLTELITDLEAKCEQPAEELLKDVKSTLSRCENVTFEEPEENKNEICSKKSDSPKLKMPSFVIAKKDAMNDNIKMPKPFCIFNTEAKSDTFENPKFRLPFNHNLQRSSNAAASATVKKETQQRTIRDVKSTLSRCEYLTFEEPEENKNEICSKKSDSPKLKIPSFVAANNDAMNYNIDVLKFGTVKEEAMLDLIDISDNLPESSNAAASPTVKKEMPRMLKKDGKSAFSRCETVKYAEPEGNKNKIWSMKSDSPKDGKSAFSRCETVKYAEPEGNKNKIWSMKSDSPKYFKSAFSRCETVKYAEPEGNKNKIWSMKSDSPKDVTSTSSRCEKVKYAESEENKNEIWSRKSLFTFNTEANSGMFEDSCVPEPLSDVLEKPSNAAASATVKKETQQRTIRMRK